MRVDDHGRPAHRAVAQALLVSYTSVVWGAVAGTLSIVVGALAHSTALIGTGASVLADLVSSVVLIWRFRAEREHRSINAATAEHRAQLVSASCLLVLAVGLTIASVIRLIGGQGATAEPAAIALAAASLVVLPVLCLWKYNVAARVPSRALRTDAHIGVVGAFTALLTLLGLIATSQLGWNRADPAAALAIAAIAAVTGISELRSPQQPV